MDARAARRVRERLAVYYDEFGLGTVLEPSDPSPGFDEEQFQLVLDLRPPVVSFHFGLPPAAMLTCIKQTGTVVLSSATTVAEARALEAQGADGIIAQGLEAGGHRGTFTDGMALGLVGTIALVPQVVDAVRVPVIAAGGIGDARDIADGRSCCARSISPAAREQSATGRAQASRRGPWFRRDRRMASARRQGYSPSLAAPSPSGNRQNPVRWAHSQSTSGKSG
jgi:hypothetical protein